MDEGILEGQSLRSKLWAAVAQSRAIRAKEMQEKTIFLQGVSLLWNILDSNGLNKPSLDGVGLRQASGTFSIGVGKVISCFERILECCRKESCAFYDCVRKDARKLRPQVASQLPN